MAWLAACATWQQVFQAFGPVKEVSMIPNADTGKHKGYGFIEFEEHEAATQAIAVNVEPLRAARWCRPGGRRAGAQMVRHAGRQACVVAG